MDVQLPGMTGYEAARRLKADPATQAIPIIALTGQAMCGEEEKARTAGCDAYLTKPVDAPSFRETLRCFLSTNDKRAK
jgi:two-component system cell cycle response regulator DivK